MVRPLNQFCCGCSLTFGVKIIVVLNLIQNIFYLATTTSNIIFKIPTFGFNVSLAMQTFNAAFCLLGLPFIAAAIWGVLYRQESHLRLYFIYLIVSFIMDMVYIITFLIMQDPCSSIPTVLRKHGSAFACGFLRIGSLGFILGVSIIELYFLFTVWSLCEDFKAGGSGAGFPELLGSGGENRGRVRYANKRPDIGNMFAQHFNTNYGAFEAPGYGGGRRIFGGPYHETSFPPLQKFQGVQ
eukprot:gnl/TRDRNA2_/TRDRNA2_188475_c0_seq1.p1 gnl/TRDRNA2_/TRDRNA2_188475_c0~~gnl/TRDRNA2_/TRDRNA2_188475_c0_seq1.p1  ORF type:complete len:240 (+),score=43.29 gnl/TRDRNA2_/TRDRNA2_188475_c0_seq1:86-805(+)